MLLRKLGNTVVELVPHFVAGHGAEQRGGNLDGEVQLALVTDVDDHWIRSAAAGEKMRDLFDGLLRRRKPDAYRRPLG